VENIQNQVADGDVPAPGTTDAVLDEIDRLTVIVSDMLRLARAEAHPSPVTVDVARLTADRIDTWTALAEAGGVELGLTSPPPPLLVSAVPGAVEQVLDNLLDNALDVSPPGARVLVDLAACGDVVQLQVTDEGPGLSDDQKAHALTRFWRADASSAGTGLGLAIVDALVTASGGSVRLDDASPSGLVVTVELRADHR
jgi:signal transduction histidine kinase